MEARAILPVVVVVEPEVVVVPDVLPEVLEVLPVEVLLVSSAVAEGEFTSTPSPPPHAESANKASITAQTALISLKVKSTLLPASLGAKQKLQVSSNAKQATAGIEGVGARAGAARWSWCKLYAAGDNAFLISHLCRL
jgi:hypothetical protein